MPLVGLPTNRFRLWLTKQSFGRLLVLWAILYVALGFLFVCLYLVLPSAPIKSSTDDATSDFWTLVHFSFVTQATVGYGDYAPVGWARLVAAVQAFFGLTMNALALAIAFYKFVKHPAPVRFPQALVYDPVEHTFWFRFWNIDADDLRNVNLMVTAFEPRSGGAYDTVVNKVDIDYNDVRWVPSIHLFALRSGSNGGQHHFALGERDEAISLSPLNASGATTIRLDLSGYFHTTGDAFFLNKDYSLREIRCGKFHDVDNVQLAQLSRRAKARHIAARFESIERTADHQCISCKFNEGCQLDVAVAIRNKRSKNK